MPEAACPEAVKDGSAHTDPVKFWPWPRTGDTNFAPPRSPARRPQPTPKVPLWRRHIGQVCVVAPTHDQAVLNFKQRNRPNRRRTSMPGCKGVDQLSNDKRPIADNLADLQTDARVTLKKATPEGGNGMAANQLPGFLEARAHVLIQERFKPTNVARAELFDKGLNELFNGARHDRRSVAEKPLIFDRKIPLRECRDYRGSTIPARTASATASIRVRTRSFEHTFSR